MEKNNNWDIFEKSGKITDYLNYIDTSKTISNCELKGDIITNGYNNRCDSNKSDGLQRR